MREPDSTPSKASKKPWWIIALVCGVVFNVLLLSFVLFFLLHVTKGKQMTEANAEKYQSDMQAEWKKISPLPGAVQKQNGAIRKSDHGIVNQAYKSNLSYPEIKAYYDAELARQGWKFAREGDVEFDGRDYGGKELLYCKDRFTANLQYAGKQETEFGWTYTFSLTWGSSDECE
jgi:hypothetical protein